MAGGEEWGEGYATAVQQLRRMRVFGLNRFQSHPEVMAPGFLQVGSDKTKLRLLLVDDEFTVRGVIREWLEEDGHCVETADDGIQGLERFKDGAWDLVITDRVMPRLDGDGLARAIKEIDPLVPIILVTAFADRPERGPSPFDMIIRKPLNHDTMRAAIASFMANRH